MILNRFYNMNSSRKLSGIIVAAMMLSCISMQAQNQSLKVDNKQYALHEIQKITFSESNVLLTLKNETQVFSPFSTWFFPNYTSIDKTNEDNTFSIYPNPVSDILYIDGKEPPGIVCIYDLNGRQIIRVEINETPAPIDLSNLKSGFYFVKTNNQTVKIIKK